MRSISMVFSCSAPTFCVTNERLMRANRVGSATHAASPRQRTALLPLRYLERGQWKGAFLVCSPQLPH